MNIIKKSVDGAIPLLRSKGTVVFEADPDQTTLTRTRSGEEPCMKNVRFIRMQLTEPIFQYKEIAFNSIYCCYYIANNYLILSYCFSVLIMGCAGSPYQSLNLGIGYMNQGEFDKAERLFLRVNGTRWIRLPGISWGSLP